MVAKDDREITRGGFTAVVRGIEVKCATLAELTELLARYGEPAQSGPAPLRSVPPSEPVAPTRTYFKQTARPPGRPPWGYDFVDGRWQHSVAAPIVRAMYHRAARGEDAETIAAWLNKTGVPPRRTKHNGRLVLWDRLKVHRLLQSRVYLGSWETYGEVVELPPIVDEATWSAAQKIGLAMAPPPDAKKTLVAEETIVSSIQAVGLDSVLPTAVEWLWQYRIPANMITVLYGPPGVGKGTVTAALAAHISTGKTLPDDSGTLTPRNVLFVAGEDDKNSVLRPRLMAAGADLSRVSVIGREHMLRLPAHLPELEQQIRATEASLVVIDPLRAFIASDRRVRDTFVPLEHIAQSCRATILIIHHSVKHNEAKPMGTQDIVGIPRSVLMVGEDRGRCTVSQYKKNLAPDCLDVHYKLVDQQGIGVVAWLRAPKEALPKASKDVATTAHGEGCGCLECVMVRNGGHTAKVLSLVAATPEAAEPPVTGRWRCTGCSMVVDAAQRDLHLNRCENKPVGPRETAFTKVDP